MKDDIKRYTLKYLISAAVVLSVITGAANAQESSLDWHLIDIGPMRQLIKNTGLGGADVGYTGQYGGTEYPVGSFVNYGPLALWVAAKQGGQIKVSTGGPWPNHFQNRHELYPSAEPWDTVWVANNREVIDIPYWPNYQGVSDQDVICRYNDYTIVNVQDHVPMDIDIIQVTYAWNSMEFLVHQFYIIPKRESLSDVYVGLFGNMGIGMSGVSNINDSFGSYDQILDLGFMDGGHPYSVGPQGFKLLPDDSDDFLKLTWTDRYSGQMNLEPPPSTDEARYAIMSTPGIFHDEVQDRHYGYFYHGLGPYPDVAVGDTVHFTFVQIFGNGFDGVRENLARFYVLKAQDFNVPAPPPPPPVRFQVANHEVTFSWDPQPGDINPEEYTDRYRLDDEPSPFEGYRVYKSTESKAGPWTLLAEYDRVDDDIGANLGLQHSYTDYGLLNNLEYYYTVTAFSKPDDVMGFLSQESSKSFNSVLVVPGTAAPKSVGQVAVVPNPYRGDQKYYQSMPAWEKPSFGGVWIEEDRRIQFINLPSPSVIEIYTLSGKFVNSIRHDDSERGFEDWNLVSHVGQTVASGIYLFSVKSLSDGQVQVGKFVIIK